MYYCGILVETDIWVREKCQYTQSINISSMILVYLVFTDILICAVYKYHTYVVKYVTIIMIRLMHGKISLYPDYHNIQHKLQTTW